MKRTTLTILVAVVLVLAFAGTASASGYLTPDGTSPHGNYSNSTNKCKVCHAVHGATGPQALLQSTRANACVYCHITGGISSIVVYNGVEANYTSDNDKNHANTHGNTGYNGCASCHSVHGAGTVAWSTKILKKSPAPRGSGSISGDAADLNEFCADCHDNRQTTAAADRCSTVCHDTDASSQNHMYVNTAGDGTSHVMKAADNTHAWVGSNDCRSCHSGGTVANSSFPHFTSGVQFLSDTEHTATSPLDAVCLDCHTNTGDGDSYVSGVGKTF